MSNPSQDSECDWRQIDRIWKRTQQYWRDSAMRYFEDRAWRDLERLNADYRRALHDLMTELSAAAEASRAHEIVPSPPRS